jgi:hypothetical protein
MIIGLVIGECTAKKITDVESIMQQRFEPGFGAFWLSHHESGYPVLNVLIRDDLAALHFLEQENEPGYLSIGNLPNVDLQGTTEFAISTCRGDDLIIPNKSLITIATALDATKEFFISGCRPKCVQWIENP